LWLKNNKNGEKNGKKVEDYVMFLNKILVEERALTYAIERALGFS